MLLLYIVPPLHNLTHPLEGNGYQFWSGIGSDFGELTLVGTMLAVLVTLVGVYRQHTCHVERCWRLSFHPVEGTTRRVCHHHHTAKHHRLMQLMHDRHHADRLAHGESVERISRK